MAWPLQICEKLEDIASVFSICWTRVYNYLGKHPRSESLTFKYEWLQWYPSDHSRACLSCCSGIYHRMRKGKVNPHVTHLHYGFDKHDKDASFMAFCWGISSCFCRECSFFCNQVAVTNCPLRWRLAASFLKRFVLMLCWFRLYWHLPLKPAGCPSCVRLCSSPHRGTAVLAFIFLFPICFTRWNIRALLHCQFLNSV